MKINLNATTIKKAQELIHNGDISCRELVVIHKEEIKKKNSEINGFLEVFEDAYEAAEKEDEFLKSGNEPRPLSGIPLAVKDNILIKGKTASAGSRILENYRAAYDATVIRKLRDAGAIFLGRTNMDEFAMGSSTENSAFGPVKNPYDLKRVSGGSSGGSAAAISSLMSLGALGSDTGGSIRLPAAFCGVVGLKPTYGAVSRFGLIAMASSLDQIGPFAKTVEDAEIIFNVIKGKDLADSTSVESDIRHPTSDIRHPKIGIPKEIFGEGLDKDVAEKIKEAAEKLKTIGAEIKEISLPSFKYALACYYIIMTAEVSSNLARFDGVKYGFHKNGRDLLGDYLETRGQGFGKEAKRRIILGTYVLSAGYYDAYYLKAQQARQLIKKDFENVFKEVDVVLTPTAPAPPFKIGEKIKDPLSMYLSDIYTVPVNLAGLPAISVPFGTAEREGKKLPIGVQIIAPWFKEDYLFKVGKKLELNY